MAGPRSFPTDMEKWVYNQCKESLFFVYIVPKSPKAVLSVIKKVKVVAEAEQVKASHEASCSTGFVVAEKPDHLELLTCAHSLSHVFSSDEPISKKQAERLFDVFVICDHYEESFRKQHSAGDVKRVIKERKYVKAKFAGINCKKDLMLLHIQRSKILDLHGKTCQGGHPALVPCGTPPDTLDKVLMVSWPSFLYRTTVTGKISNCDRQYPDVCGENPNGYEVKLIEVAIPSEKGSSGAPLVTGSANVIGVLHGGAGSNSFSYFISYEEIRSWLIDWDIKV